MNERNWKNQINEGGEGYNPAEIARKEAEDANYRVWVGEQKAKEHAELVAYMATLGVVIS